MKKVLVVDCCIREESRTRRILNAFLGDLAEVERVELNPLELLPLDNKSLALRDELLARGEFGHTMFKFSHQFADADMVVLAAPFWDMGIPAKLKTYFEHVSCSGITFGVTEELTFVGRCRAEDMVYLTTRGMDIEDGSDMEQASPYLRALCSFFGIENFHMVSAWGLDVIPPEETEVRLNAACEEARELSAALVDTK